MQSRTNICISTTVFPSDGKKRVRPMRIPFDAQAFVGHAVAKMDEALALHVAGKPYETPVEQPAAEKPPETQRAVQSAAQGE